MIKKFDQLKVRSHEHFANSKKVLGGWLKTLNFPCKRLVNLDELERSFLKGTDRGFILV